MLVGKFGYSGDSGDSGCSGSSEDAGKASPEVAREAPSAYSERSGDDFRVDFRRFPRLHRVSDSTRCENGRTFVSAGRRSTSEGSQTLRKSRKLTKIGSKFNENMFQI